MHECAFAPHRMGLAFCSHLFCGPTNNKNKSVTVSADTVQSNSVPKRAVNRILFPYISTKRDESECLSTFKVIILARQEFTEVVVDICFEIEN